VRILIAILFSIIWVGNPIISTAAAFQNSAKVCSHCDCGGTGCCMTNGDSDSQPAPAVPVRSVSSHDWQVIQPLIESIFLAVKTSLPKRPATCPASLSSSKVPLYQRNCSFLI